MEVSEIKNRIDDALALWNNGRQEGAFLIVLIAFAAAARKRYPNLKDREGFEQLFRDGLSVRLNVEYRGEAQSIEHIFYKWLRCRLVHEGSLPIDIEFIDTDLTTIRAGGAPEYILKLGNGWFDRMIQIALQVKDFES